MKHTIKAAAALLSALLCAVGLCSCGAQNDTRATYPDASVIVLSDHTATIDGTAVEVFDYTWHCDPSVSHTETDNAPAEYHTGEKPETDAAAYIDRDQFYFPQLDEDEFKLIDYDGEQEWAYYYRDGEHDDYIFATLPKYGDGMATAMMHTDEQAAENPVLHIQKAGTYILRGSWHGQIRVELGDTDTVFADENARVTLVLDGVTVTCDVAPGILFKSVYECDNGWRERDTYSEQVETADAGATVIIADGSTNTVTGNNIFRMLKTKYKDENSDDAVKTQKKLRKYDGAFYSCMTMNIVGEEKNTGTLTINAGFEGLDTELHLTVGGNVTINAQNDGINVNEDNVAVLRLTAGKLTITAGQGPEGDGIDSNGYIVIDGADVAVNGITPPDSALDSDKGIFYRSGTVTVDGEQQTLQVGNVGNAVGGKQNGQPGQQPPQGGRDPGMDAGDFDLREFKEKVAALGDDATRDDVMALLGMGGRGDGQQPPQGTDTPPEPK